MKMKILVLIGAASLLLSPSFVFGANKPVSEKDKVSYSIGINIGQNLVRQGVDVSLEALIGGVTDAIKEKKPLLSDKEMETTMNNFRKTMIDKMEKQRGVQAKSNQKESDAFLKKNKKRKGVKTLPSGLQYEVIKEGKGKKPGEKDVVITNYVGTLLNGEEFDSSYKRKKPATFPLQSVITGWREALKLMPVGSKWKLYLPPNLAYGNRGNGRNIGPNAALIFEIELLEIKK